MGIKRLKDTLIYLNSDYSIKTIDGEPCLYRKISNKYDIEVSGLNSSSKTFLVDIYVWDISKGIGVMASIVENISGIKSKEELKSILDSLFVKYHSNP